MENVTRDVISDLWPLYKSGEASTDTRTLVETFLRDDREFAQTLAELDRLHTPAFDAPSLTPDHELKTLQRVRKRLAGPLTLLQLALACSCSAFGVLVSDTSFDVSPRRFITTASIAVCFWAAFLVRLYKGRREVLIQVRR